MRGRQRGPPTFTKTHHFTPRVVSALAAAGMDSSVRCTTRHGTGSAGGAGANIFPWLAPLIWRPLKSTHLTTVATRSTQTPAKPQSGQGQVDFHKTIGCASAHKRGNCVFSGPAGTRVQASSPSTCYYASAGVPRRNLVDSNRRHLNTFRLGHTSVHKRENSVLSGLLVNNNLNRLGALHQRAPRRHRRHRRHRPSVHPRALWIVRTLFALEPRDRFLEREGLRGVPIKINGVSRKFNPSPSVFKVHHSSPAVYLPTSK